MESAKILNRKINTAGEVTTGMIVTYHFWPGIIEMAMRAGMDYIILDLEHLSFDASSIAEACAIGRRADFPVLIRPPAAEFTPIRLALDLGPCGLVIPYVENMETMGIIREAVYLKPRGRRRPGGMGNLWVSNFNYDTWKTDFEDDLIIIPQIESVKGLNHVDEIAGDPLTTTIGVGPYDLSADLGVCWDPASPLLRRALQTIREAGRKVGKNMWMIGDGPDLIERGYDFLCISEPMMFLQDKLTQLNQQVKMRNKA